MHELRRQLSYSNVISTLCLFMLLGGGAYAAVDPLSKNSVGRKQLKPNAVNGAKVADRSLTAVDIRGAVDSATSARDASHATDADRAKQADHAAASDRATSADTIAGAGPASFFQSSHVQRLDLSVVQATAGTRKDSLLTMGPLTMTTSCGLGTKQTLSISASTTAAGGSMGWDFVRDNGTPPTVAEANVVSLSSSPTPVLTRIAELSEVGAGEFIYRDPSTTISIDFRYFVGTLTNGCQVFGTALQA